ncbi:hypothetical protein E2562_030783 [Oryza meyeriana var. granulata]|uniref:Uncharacterized protein n=1 Tax=Oryza meyeriana var. granulata TaxID=110450 RepID=A0A6G1CAV3_9ORYZ|nr:hypothetical protein E2562_030783 [Oryza meyeriana var. granulata]
MEDGTPTEDTVVVGSSHGGARGILLPSSQAVVQRKRPGEVRAAGGEPVVGPQRAEGTARADGGTGDWHGVHPQPLPT